MEIKTFTHPAPLPNVPPDLVAFDLEMANSFRSGPGVICMIGVEHYDPAQGVAHATIASITSRSEEQVLVQWLLDYLEQFHATHPAARLLTFSGSDNDIPWVKERMARFDMQTGEESILARMANLDLKLEFFQRTQNIKISLKRLEEIFGIDRASSVTSKKVSYVLTDILKEDGRHSEIPARLFEYLAEDVYNLLVIYDRWRDIPLDHFNFTDGEFDELLQSLSRTVRKFCASPRVRKGNDKELAAMGEFATRVEKEANRARGDGNFRTFALPPFPPVRIRHSEFERILKKYNYLNSLEVVEPETGAYRLKPEMFRGQGALAVVRHQGGVLMIQRSQEVERAAGFWGLPGGVVEAGETPAECAIRELKEEVNLEARLVSVLGVTTSFSGEFDLTWVELAVDDPSTLRPDPREVAVAHWVAPEQLAHLKPLIPGALEGFANFLGFPPPSKNRKP